MPAPVLQQLESAQTQDVSVNDCFRPVSRYWDRITRPEQLLTALPEAMRVLTSPAETGAVTLSLPQDTQTEAFDYPEAFFEERVWHDRAAARRSPGHRARGDRSSAPAASRSSSPAAACSTAKRPTRSCISPARPASAVAETQAGKSAMPWDHPLALGAIGVTGSLAANQAAREADLVIAIGTRLADFTTMSKTAFADPDVRFVGINVCAFDAFKHAAVPVVADARAALDELTPIARRLSHDGRLSGGASTRASPRGATRSIGSTRSRGAAPFPQAVVVGAVNDVRAPWRMWSSRRRAACRAISTSCGARGSPNTYHLEYGYSCMGYEIAGGLGVKMADPAHEVYVMVGDGSYLMMAQEIVTSIQEGYKLIVVLLDSQGYASIGGLSRIGRLGRIRHRSIAIATPRAARSTARRCPSISPPMPNRSGRSCTASPIARRSTPRSPPPAPPIARPSSTSRSIHSPACPGYESWWDVAVAEVSEQDSVRAARATWEAGRKRERYFL